MPTPPPGPTYNTVNMTMRDHVIVLRYRYEHLLRLETLLKLNLLVFRDGTSAADNLATITAQQMAAEEAPPDQRVSEEVRKVIFGNVPGYQSYGPPTTASDEDDAAKDEGDVDSSTPSEPSEPKDPNGS